MDLLGGRSVVALGNHELLPALDAVDAEIIRLQGLRLQLVARTEESGYAQELGARDTVELLALRHRRDRSEAWRDVRLARALPKYTAVGTALADGITTDTGVRPMQTAHAAAIVTELERVRTRVPVEDLDVAEEQLVGLAAHLSPKELRSAAKQLCNLLDSDGPEPEEQKAYGRESLTLITAENGVKFRGYLANENAELLRAVIHAGARPHKTVDGELDPRARDKRQADALTTALTVAANAWDTDTAGHGAKANITVTIDLDDLRSATANATGQTVYGDDLSAATIRRLACDANVIPLVLGSNSEPLDVGRRERLVTKHIRHALNARDKGCVVCSAPPVMCDAHHLTHWQDGGVTALTNLALLCRHHHVDLHNARWTITITNGKVQVARPTWATPTPAHPGAGSAWATPAAVQPASGFAWVTPAPVQRDSGSTGATPVAAQAGSRSACADPAAVRPVSAEPTCPDPPPPAEPPPNSPTPPVPSGVGSARPAHPGYGPRPPDAAIATGGVWDDTAVPARRTSRWKADEATLAAAARFAVWGERTSTDPPSFATV
ncbi:HNH endonuclease signature motif containing protein [Kribbella sp.]|uniref:HNH endonuclease signature motif containing protein n=1 Tax=Kribbella sp. TaxID=1871183 RepID=UPI002D668969|nr:DUF222 domain-containing protein [Kribbella sp.]HZX04313.1 DUF222 domain-containing protein [Kribbella sp.]